MNGIKVYSVMFLVLYLLVGCSEHSTQKDKQASYRDGLQYYMTGRFDLAIKEFNNAIKIDVNYAEAYFGRGSVYSRTGKLDLAITDLSKALDLNGSFVDAYIARGVTFSKLHQYDKSIKDFEKALDLDPNNFRASIGLTKAKKEKTQAKGR